jgi:hypothetical protein
MEQNAGYRTYQDYLEGMRLANLNEWYSFDQPGI